MSESLLFSRAKLETFLRCQRRFQLRYLSQVPWPNEPENPEQATAIERGEALHQLIERHYLGLSVPDEILQQFDVQVRRWWLAFLQTAPAIGEDERPLAEMTLTVPSGEHALLGRFDLLVLGPQAVHIYDWKTGTPRTAAELQQDWQTRLYLALVVEGHAALALPHLQPEQIQLTYWYARQPAASVTISYSRETHIQNWLDIQQTIQRIETQMSQEHAWPLTDDLTACARCVYQSYCGRFETPALVERLLAERRAWEAAEPIPWEPDLA